MIRHVSRKLALVSAIATLFAAGGAHAFTIDTWNPNNVVTDLPNWPPGAVPSHTPGVTYDSTLFMDTTRLDRNGAVIWKEGAVVAPGAQVLTDSPNPGNNCIITSGTNRSIPGAVPKTCTDEFQSAKRVKLDARAAGSGTIIPDPNGSIVLTDGKPLDMVFNVSAADATARTYRVFKKFINATGQRMDGFVVELGFDTGDQFRPSTTGDGLKFTMRQQGQNPGSIDFTPLPYYSTPPGNSELGSLMSAGLFGNAADNQNRTVDGYFYLPGPTIPDENGNACATDPSGTGRTYFNLAVRAEDRIETVGNVQGLHYCLFGNMLPQGELPLGIFWDDDGDPVTDADTIADWDGSGKSPACDGTPCWQTYVVLDVDPASPTYGDPVLTTTGNFIRPANAPVPVPQHVVDYWVAHPEPATPDGTQFYFIAPLDDMGLVNNNYHITVASITSWPTYNPATGTATFTMRTSNIGEGVPFDAPWLATLPPELPPPLPAADVALSGFTVNGTSPATVIAGTEVPVAVTVSNAAGQPTASGQVVGEATDPTGKVIASFLTVFSDLAAGTSQTLALNWLVADPTGLPANATFQATAVIDGGDPVLSNNTRSVNVTIGAEPIVDMVLDRLSVPREATSGRTYKISVTIANRGEVSTTGSVTVTANGSTVATLPYTLAAGATSNLSFNWKAPTVKKTTTVNWRATVSATDDVNLDNNSRTATTRVSPSRRGDD